jgi:hypothetical protein
MTLGEKLMSRQEADRYVLIEKHLEGRLTQREIARLSNVTDRTVRHWVRSYHAQGALGLVSKRRGTPSNNRLLPETKTQAIDLMTRLYPDFGPTFAHEKLTEVHGLILSVETLRKWMVESGLWKTRRVYKPKIHPMRPRRAYFGELVQIDGSPHDWFEGRSEPCTLIVFIDDATSALLWLQFAPAETTDIYLQGLREYLSTFGRPVAIYSDRHSIFRTTRYDEFEPGDTQFTRAIKSLDIQPIHANSPQAKGRVERANQTLQDRLLKEMRLRGIDNIHQANAFLPEFIQDYNQRFAKAPYHLEDAHRPLLHTQKQLNAILSKHFERKLDKHLCFQFNHQTYQLQLDKQKNRMKGKPVLLVQDISGELSCFLKDQSVPIKTITQNPEPVPIANHKTVNSLVKQTMPRKQPKSHPWKRQINQQIQMKQDKKLAS